MLEIRYDKNTKILTGWWGSRLGNWAAKLKNRPDEAMVELDIDIPGKLSGAWLYDETTSSLLPNPAYTLPRPPRSTHISVLEDVDPTKVRPAKVKREWNGNVYHFDCFVTETVKDQYVSGDIVIGDYVLVHFDDVGEQIVTAKVFKSW